MPLYVMSCRDKPNSLELRMANREAHLAYMKSLGDQVKLGGPYLDGQDQMAGSLIIVEADTIEAAQAISANDPYRLAGLFETVEITPFRATMKNLG
jgi:uncharacterized protein YciI